MEIKVTYQPTIQELTKASSLFIEKKPFFLILINIMNLFAIVIIILICLKLLTPHTISPEEWMAGITTLLWLFGRRPANEWLIAQRLKNNRILQLPIHITLSLNGIMWEGKGLTPGNMSWNNIRYVFEAKNGIIIPNAGARYLWLPYRGFSSENDINQIKQLITDRNIIVRSYRKWEC